MSNEELNNESKKRFARKLTALRQSHGWSQRKFAEITGFGRSTISMWELGEREPNFKQLNVLADRLGVTVSELIDDAKNEIIVIDRAIRQQEEDELAAYLEMLRTRPEMRILLDTVAGATKEEVEANVHFLEALRGKK